jgi:predicted ATPase/DNA-binding XRE family transcriptional regulator
METETSFGGWVRRRRKALDLLQKELAAQAGCSVNALQKIERDERRPSRQLAERLAACLAVPAEERAAFLRVARGERMVERLHQVAQPVAAPVEASAVQPSLALPIPSAPLLGREVELTEIARVLHDPHCRLLTLTGPGGIGKTRLAIEVATHQQDAQARLVAFAPLTSVVGREQTITAIADALGVVLYAATDRADQLVAYLRDKDALLVLDNFEHLLPDASCATLVGELLRGAPRITILATSREPLSLQLEWVFEVQGLPLPQGSVADEFERNSATRLFLQRAQQARVGFVATPQDREAIWRICRLVDGLPLAIELAAGWVRALSCQEIAREIQRNVDFLATSARDVSERHRSIRAVFDHSWALLSPEEQHALTCLSIFRGGFGREAAEAVAGASLPLLSLLVSKSLLRRTETGRYDLHELVRQYAFSQLRRDPQAEAQIRELHCRYYAAVMERSGPAFKGPDQPAVAAELMGEIANIRLAWEWAATHALATQLTQAADTLFWLYEWQSNCPEGVPLFGQAVQQLQAAIDSAAPDTGGEWERHLALGQALSYQGFFCFRQGQHPQGRKLLEQSRAALQPLADPSARAAVSNAVSFLGMVTYMMGEYHAGRRLLEEGLAMKRALNDRWGMAVCLRHLGLTAHALGDYAEAHRLLSESLQLSRAMGNTWATTFSLNFLATAAYAQGAYDEARHLLYEALALSQTAHDRYNIATALRGLGLVHTALGQRQQAARFFRDSIAIWREIGEQGGLAQTLNGLGHALLVLEDRSGAWRCFSEALELAWQAQITPAALDTLLGVAALRGQAGDVKTALEILLALHAHPATSHGTRDQAKKLCDDLEALPAGHADSLYVRARDTSLEALVEEVLAVSSIAASSSLGG